MRFLFALIIFVMLLAIIVFAINNAGTTVPVTLFSTHPDLPLIAVVIGSIVFGVVVVGIVAIIEGAQTRLENHRLRRELRKLETEVNFLRTEPRTSTPMSESPPLPPAVATSTPAATREEPPAAPVYDAEDSPDDTDPDDDMYAGGRAI